MVVERVPYATHRTDVEETPGDFLGNAVVFLINNANDIRYLGCVFNV